MPTATPTLTPEQLDAFGKELDAIRTRVVADLGERDADYIKKGDPRPARARDRRPRAAVRELPAARVARGNGGAEPVEDPRQHGDRAQRDARAVRLDEGSGAGRQDVRVGHGVPRRSVAALAQLHAPHLHEHRQGKDRDIGYAILRMSEDERWRPYYLGNPIYATLLALFFQYGVALHDLETERIAKGTWNLDEKRAMLGEMWRKVRAQTLKDYVLFPAAVRSLLPARDRGQRDGQPGAQPVGVHDHLLRALPRWDA